MNDGNRPMPWAAFLVAAIVIAATVLALTCCKSRGRGRGGGATPAERANGCPLDAIEYDPPAFARADATVFSNLVCYKVHDRVSGQEWWVLWMRGEWVVLPITEVR